MSAHPFCWSPSRQLSALTLGFALWGGAASSGLAQATAETAPAAPQISEAKMLEVFGWMTGMRTGISQLGLNDEEAQAFIRGLEMARRGEETDVDLQAVGGAIAQFMQAKFDAHMAAEKAAQVEQAAAFWTELAGNSNVVITPSGLGYEIQAAGGERKPTATDRVRVHYHGSLLNGKVFDSSVERGEPYETALNQVIPGWTEGVQAIGEGGKIRLYVPPQLGYGDYGSGDIPPGATLIFDVELLAILTPAAPPPAPAPATP